MLQYESGDILYFDPNGKRLDNDFNF